MPRASKNNPIPEKDLERLQDNLYSLLSSLNNPTITATFMNDFLSDEEKIMLSKRLGLYIMLDLNIDTPTIMNALSISLETVRTHKIRSMRQSLEFKQIVRSLQARERNNDRLERIGNIAKKILSAPDKMKKGQFVSAIYDSNPRKK